MGCLALLLVSCEAKSELEAPKKIPLDIATIAARFKLMEQTVAKLAAKEQEVTKVITEVEAAGGETLKRVDSSEKKLMETSAKAAVNKFKILEIRNETEQASEKVQEVLSDMRGLMKIVETLDESSMDMGSQAKKVATQVANLEDNVKRLMPGESGLTDRITKAQETIAKYQKDVDAGLPGMVEKSLRGHFKAATKRLQTLTEEVEKSNVD